MCDRDHQPIGTFGGFSMVVCDDIPPDLDGVIVPSIEKLLASPDAF